MQRLIYPLVLITGGLLNACTAHKPSHATTAQTTEDAPAKASNQSPIPRPPQSFTQDPQAIDAAQQRGARTAAADIQSGLFRILVYGGSAAATDPQTGWPTFPIMCCDTTGQVIAETDSYNRVMRSWYAQHRPTTIPH